MSTGALAEGVPAQFRACTPLTHKYLRATRLEFQRVQKFERPKLGGEQHEWER